MMENPIKVDDFWVLFFGGKHPNALSDDELVHVSWFVSVMKQADPVNTITE